MSHYLSSLFSLEGKTALIAGGAGAIGSAISEAFARAGARVIVHDLSADRLAGLQERFEAENLPFHGLQVDLDSAAACDNLVAQARGITGRLDILVNLQGTNRRKPIVDVTQDDFDVITSVNFRSVYFLSRAVQPVMKSQGGGKILHFSSLSANISFDTISVYAATKAAVTSLTRSMAHEWAADNIQVNAIEPGFVQTEFTRPLWDDEYRSRWFADYIPAGHLAVPQDLITTSLSLVAPASRYITGRSVVVDGGVLSGDSWVEKQGRPSAYP
ncbi:MAG: dehydrogenase [Shinella sp. 65-6]|mgnify:CR=1 FL=1|nr:SDR family oxidoreductase [Hyphomicrobiales bacterium]OJU89406.1 MAG: dehydrogenase [Shinella sp. 65-6]